MNTSTAYQDAERFLKSSRLVLARWEALKYRLDRESPSPLPSPSGSESSLP